MPKHVIKFEKGTWITGVEADGKRIAAESWCGRPLRVYDKPFLDAQHVALAVGGSLQPCKDCIKAIIKDLEKEL